MKRGPQVILPKDIGIIIAYTCIDKESVCIDAGTGSGWLAVSLARICKEVYSYDKREDFLAIAAKNKDMLHLSNLILKHGDVTKKIEEKNADLFTLDLPDAEKALKNVKKALKPGGYVAAYIPNTEQVSTFVNKLSKLKFVEHHTIEVIVRDIFVRKEGTRPSTKGIWHTAYLVFARKPKSAE